MGRKSYSRQAMQKFVQQATGFAVSSGGNLRPINLEIPEEIVVKRLVLNVVCSTANGISEGAFVATICQNDSFNPDAGDALDPNRIVRSGCGSGSSVLNLDHTITMRKLAGSGLSVQLNNVSATSESYTVKLTVHYLEV